MHGSDSTMQYYVPYLSGIQLNVDPSKKARNPVQDNERSSEGSSNSRLDKLPNHDKILENVVDLSVSELNRISLRNQYVTGSLSSGEHVISSPQGRLLFEYLDYEPPFVREPLANKVTDLASKFPELKTYRSCDLSPSSWISVLCLLSNFPLSLSTPPPLNSMDCNETEPSIKLPLPTFGLASYKLKVSVWNQKRAEECQKS